MAFDFKKAMRRYPIYRHYGESWDDCLIRYCKQYEVHHDGPLCALFQLEREIGAERAAHEAAWLFGLED